MADRVPIGTHPGLASAFLGADLIVGDFSAAVEVDRVFLRRTDQDPGDTLSMELRNAAGGGGDAIAVSFAAGADSAVGTGSITGTQFFLRGVTAGGDSANVSGYFELPNEGGGGGGGTGPVTGPLLATLDRFKQYLGISDTADDTALQNILVGTSAKIQTYIGRSIIQKVVTGEKYDGPGADQLILDRYPVTAVSVTEDGVVLPAAAIDADERSGVVYRRTDDGAEPACWTTGRRCISVDYTSGFATIPEDLVEQALKQAAYEWKQSDGKRAGLRSQILDSGGTAEYLTGPWAPGVDATLRSWRARELY